MTKVEFLEELIEEVETVETVEEAILLLENRLVDELSNIENWSSLEEIEAVNSDNDFLE